MFCSNPCENYHYISAGITLTVIPSNDVKVNQSVELQCELDTIPSPPVIVSFKIQSPSSNVCTLEPNYGECQNTSDPCITRYNASCPSTTRYSIQVIVPSNWNNVSVVCQTLYQKSNSAVFFVEGIFLIWCKRLNMVNIKLSRNNIYYSYNNYINLFLICHNDRRISIARYFQFKNFPFRIKWLLFIVFISFFNHHSSQQACFCVH